MYTIQKGDKKMDTNFEVNMNEYLPLRWLQASAAAQVAVIMVAPHAPMR